MIQMLLKEIMFYIKNVKELIVISFLFISIILLAIFAFPAQTVMPEAVPGVILWIALLCAIQLAASQSWQRHHESGETELFQLLPWLLEWSVLGKFLGFITILWLQLIILVPAAGLWLGLGPERWQQTLMGLAAGSVALSAIQLLAAGLMAGYRKGGAMLGLLTLPFAIPVIIFGTEYLRQPALWHSSLAFLLGYAGLLIPIMCLTVAANLRAGN